MTKSTIESVYLYECLSIWSKGLQFLALGCMNTHNVDVYKNVYLVYMHTSGCPAGRPPAATTGAT